jgi:hypothetical protein
LHVTYGASGGVAGVAGALMAFTVRRRLDVDELVRRRLRNAGLFLIGFGALAGLLNRRVSDVGHMTGLAVGFALGLALASPSLAVPSLAQIRAQLVRVHARGDEADLLQALVRLVQAREAQLAALIAASRSHDPADETRAEALQIEAERLSDEYRAKR